MNELSKCLCCEREVLPLIDFGLMPLVNTYEVKDKFPLAVNRCVSCCHLQLSEFVDPDVLYEDYNYCSGTGETAREFFAEFAQIAMSYFPTAQSVLDIACNDGSQLDAFRELDIKTFGIDPAKNLCIIARIKGHTHIANDFFENTDVALESMDIITAQNVLGHTPDPLKFLEKCKKIMHDGSRLLIMTSQANMVVHGECDTIYHEHISYFNLHSMMKLAERAGLTVLDVIMHPIHGTSYIFVLGKYGGIMDSVQDRLEWEFVTGMMGTPLYRWWKDHVQESITRLGTKIFKYKEKGYYTVGCGAAAKGLSILNKSGVTLDLLVDTTPIKWHKETSGMRILPFEELANLEQEKILFVILPWNLRREVRKNVLLWRLNPQDVFIDTR